MKSTPADKVGRLLLTTLPLYAIDQLTKWLVMTRFDSHDTRPVIAGWFNLVYVTNTGAAFGSFKDSNTFFIALSLTVAAGLLFFLFRGAFRDRLSGVAVALLLSGILGNVTDRLLHGHVIDFLDFHIGDHHWPSFNVADSCICIAAGLFFLTALRDSKKPAG